MGTMPKLDDVTHGYPWLQIGAPHFGVHAEVLKSFSKTDILDAVFLIIFLSTLTNYYLGYAWITFSKANAR